ncbi:hypothetical protein HDU87_007254 [Geranomyces variabilis]|uniref:DUF221-domain-containing protein n=1 Tax=Geranomyces variabilis TaxID=109894 RepID=A0AAD5TGI0_9FUNG|nr:hypothetical protein HDU87_007254 [Geranomyces variabilis]
MSGPPPTQQEILSGAGQNSVATFLSALAFNSAVAVGFFGAFCILRARVPLVYIPRTFLVSENVRTKAQKGLALLRSCAYLDDDLLIRNSGQDAFAIVSYMRTMAKFFAALVVIAVVTLIPLHATGGMNLGGLDMLTLANIAPSETKRLWAHLVVSWGYTIGCMRVVQTLLQRAATLRHSFLLSEEHRRSLNAYTLLIRDIPKHLREPNKLRVLFDRVQPGCVHGIVIAKRSRRMDRYAARRISARGAIEAEATRYLAAINSGRAGTRKRSLETLRGAGRRVRVKVSADVVATREIQEERSGDIEDQLVPQSGVDAFLPSPAHETAPANSDSRLHTPNVVIAVDPAIDTRREHFIESVENALRIAPSTGSASDTSLRTPKRPTHRSLYFVGAESDSIASNLRTLRLTTAKVSRKLRRMRNTPTVHHGAAFVVFKDVFSPHVAALANIDSRPGVMDDRQPAVNPDDVIWENLDLSFRVRKGRQWIATAIAIGLTLAWASFMTILTSLATLDRAIQYAPWLKVFNDLSPAVRGFLQGVVPATLVSLVFMLVPFCFRALARFAGEATNSGIERNLMNYYYAFLVFNILLVITISGSVITAAQEILDHPQSVLTILATSIPLVSTFFVTYVMLLALGGPSGELLQLGSLIIKPLALRFLAKTPRQIRDWCKPSVFYPGTVFAQHSFVATIGLTYCTIAPVAIVFVAAYFGLYNVAYGYQMQYVYTHLTQTGGLYLHIAARQLFLGIYLHQLVLIGLFSLKQAFIQAVVMACALVLTAIYHRHTELYKPIMTAVAAKAVVQMEAKLMHHGEDDQQWDRNASGTLTRKIRDAGSSVMGGAAPAWKKMTAAVKTGCKLDLSVETVNDTDEELKYYSSSADRGIEEIARVGNESAESVASDDTESEADSDISSHDHLDSASLPAENMTRRYLGPSDFYERLSPPSCRTAACTIWIPRDMRGCAETALAHEVHAALGDTACFTTQWARIGSNGRVKVDLENAVPCEKFDV